MSSLRIVYFSGIREFTSFGSPSGKSHTRFWLSKKRFVFLIFFYSLQQVSTHFKLIDMNKKIGLILATFLFTSILFCQDRKSYSKLLEEAQQLFDSSEYLKAGMKYFEAFRANGNKGALEERYNSACAWALANYPDSSFVQLFKIVIKGKYTNLEQFTKDTDLNPLHSDKRWNELLEIIKENKINLDKTLDKRLAATLDTVYKDDQYYRLKLDSIVNRVW